MGPLYNHLCTLFCCRKDETQGQKPKWTFSILFFTPHLSYNCSQCQWTSWLSFKNYSHHFVLSPAFDTKLSFNIPCQLKRTAAQRLGTGQLDWSRQPLEALIHSDSKSPSKTAERKGAQQAERERMTQGKNEERQNEVEVCCQRRVSHRRGGGGYKITADTIENTWTCHSVN